MTKQDLKAGMVVECRCGRVYQVFRGIERSILVDKDVIINVNEDTWIGFDDIDDDLTTSFDHDFDIMKVYKSPTVSRTTKPLNYKNWDCVFERKEVKELTVSEIEKLLGYSVKIVKE